MRFKLKILEKDVVRACLNYLEYNRRGKFWRSNTGAFQGETNGKRRFVRFGKVGSADITGILGPLGRRIEIECKRPGGVQTPDQKIFQNEIEKLGGIYILATSTQDLIDNGL
jgi:hypothetical protein